MNPVFDFLHNEHTVITLTLVCPIEGENKHVRRSRHQHLLFHEIRRESMSGYEEERRDDSEGSELFRAEHGHPANEV